MRTRAEAPTIVLICHAGEPLDRDGLASWLASTMRLAGLLIIRDGADRRWRAVRRELKRVGPFGLLDVLAFRAVARLVHSREDRRWEAAQIASLREQYPADLSRVPTQTVTSPNTDEARAFLERIKPDLAIARCKVLLQPEIYQVPRAGTFVLHPGICPEYRNAHGCFWALANRDLDRVGMTLLRIDAGVDTGPVYLHGTCEHDERRDSHIVIQQRAVLENLEAIGEKLTALARGEDVRPINTDGRQSATWGQPRLTRYLRWKLAAHRSPSPIPDPRSPIPDPRSPIPDPRSRVTDPGSLIPEPRSPLPEVQH